MQWCGCRECHISCEEIFFLSGNLNNKVYLQLATSWSWGSFRRIWHELIAPDWAIIWLWWDRTCRICGHRCQLSSEISGGYVEDDGCIKGPGQRIILPIITNAKYWYLAMVTQTFKCNFSTSCLITRHTSIWITNDCIHCSSLPSQLKKTCKKWDMTLSSSMAMYSVMRDIIMQEWYQWKEDELLFIIQATFKD